jgi:hypothetical protein|nr:MAG: hypothetical protein [Caudoviricetes sp.]
MFSENIYINILENCTTNNILLQEYIEICYNYSNFKNKNEAEKILNCKVELHHILPKCFKLGGEKDKTNHTYLPYIEHRRVHKILKDMFSGHKRKQMAFAYSRIIHRHGSKDEISIEEYLELKSQISNLIGELNSNRIITDEYRNNMSKAKSNSFWVNNGFEEIMLDQFSNIPNGYTKGRISNQNKGRIWINNGEINKMIFPDYSIPDGWEIGLKRKPNSKRKGPI